MYLGLRATTHGRPTIEPCAHIDQIDTQQRARQRAREQGSALVIALMVIILLSMIGVALFAANSRTRDTTRTRSERLQALGPIDAAIATYRFGLQSDKITAQTGYMPSQSVLDDLLGDPATGGTGKAVLNSKLPVNSKVALSEVFDNATGTSKSVLATAELGKANDKYHDFWQVYKVAPPDPSTGQDLRVWFRAWRGRADYASLKPEEASISASNARTVVATFRQGKFSDFQMVINGPIHFDRYARIDGPIHSNGLLDGVNNPPHDDAHPEQDQWRVYVDPDALSGATFRCPAKSIVTTAQGTISLPSYCGVPANKQGTGRFVSFQGLTESFAQMDAGCSSAPYTVKCYNTSGNYDVEIVGTRVRVRGPGNPAWSTSLTDDGFQAAKFNGNVNIVSTSGWFTGRFTIATTGSIRIESQNLGAPLNTPASANRSLGLFAQGDIIADPSRPSCTTAPSSTMHGVFISQSGTLTLGRGLTTSYKPSNAPASECGPLAVVGSMAFNTAPVLTWGWPGPPASKIGYTTRTYQWDTALRDAPPPFTPMTGAWESVTFADADISCLGADAPAQAGCN